ncbi:MAG: alpha/beta hydrolase [Planctomycetaceae bacterium]|nr:alpha/beta hydrolase [Planctomycetaceae bacterium]
MKSRHLADLFRTSRFLISALIGGIVAFSIRYAGHWIFDPVEPSTLDTNVVLLDPLARAHTSLSPDRRVLPAERIEWRIVTVTNREISLRGQNAGTQARNTGNTALAYRGNSTESRGQQTPTGRRADELELQSEPPLRHSTSSTDSVFQQVSHAEPLSIRGTLAETQYYVPETTFLLSSVYLPQERRRGELKLSAHQPNTAEVWPEETLAKERFLQLVQSRIQEAQTEDILVFVHGFNVSLSTATARAAQIAEDMPFHGVIIPFSWPSAARADHYHDDEACAERYFWNLAELLIDLRENLPDGVRLHLLAHSMGNRVALRALGALAGEQHPTNMPLLLDRDEICRRFPRWNAWNRTGIDTAPLSTLILAAPDVGVAEFQQRTRSIAHLASSLVLYTSDSDVALEGSSRVHGNQFRAGDSRSTVTIDGLRIIRVSGVNHLDPLGHSYYGSNPQVLSQLSQLLLSSRPVTPLPL